MGRRVSVILATLCFLALALYAMLVLALFLGQRHLIYPAPPGPSIIPNGFEKVALSTKDGLSLTAAWRPAKRDMRTIVFFHGNGDNLSGAAEATRLLADAGYGVMLADYRGYSGNPGKPDEAGLLNDGRAAIAFLHDKRVSSDRMILMGASLGSGVASRLASEYQPAGLVLVSPFTSLTDVSSHHFSWIPVRLLMRDRFDNAKTIPDFDRPVLVLHASDDRVIPVDEGRSLAEKARDGTFLRFEHDGHQLQYTPNAQAAVRGWLKRRGI